MPEWSPPRACLSAGAITVANRIGVSRGTAIWRGLLAVSAARRLARVNSALLRRVGRAGCRIASGAGAVMAVIRCPLARLGGVGDCGAGEVQVDVVERWGAGRDSGCGEPELVDRGDDLGGAVAGERKRERRADDEGGWLRYAAGSQPGHRGRGVAFDAEFEDLAAEPGEQPRRRVEGDDL